MSDSEQEQEFAPAGDQKEPEILPSWKTVQTFDYSRATNEYNGLVFKIFNKNSSPLQLHRFEVLSYNPSEVCAFYSTSYDQPLVLSQNIPIDEQWTKLTLVETTLTANSEIRVVLDIQDKLLVEPSSYVTIALLKNQFRYTDPANEKEHSIILQNDDLQVWTGIGLQNSVSGSPSITELSLFSYIRCYVGKICYSIYHPCFFKTKANAKYPTDVSFKF